MREWHQSYYKGKIRKVFFTRIGSLLRTELNVKNSAIAMNTLIIPVVTNSFNIINWMSAEKKDVY